MAKQTSYKSLLNEFLRPEPEGSELQKNGSFWERVFKGDKVIWAVFLILCAISIVEIFSATSTIVYKHHNQFYPIARHVVFLSMGLGVILLMHNIPYRFYASLIFLLIISLILLILTPFIGSSVNNADRWISILGITIQPSEFAKISLVGTIAFLLSKRYQISEDILFKWMIGLTLLVCGIIAIDNLSTALLLGAVSFMMMFIGNVNIKKLLKVLLILVVAGVFILLILKVIPPQALEKGPLKRFGTWQNRIEHFGDAKTNKSDSTYYEITDDNYQVAHAKIAISNGGVVGVFPGNSTERDFLPQAYSDFIYAIIIEEMGLLGGTVVLMLYIILLIRSGIIARKTEKLFPKYLVLGSALILSIQAFINMAVAVNLIPVTGQPLPLISRGGTSTIITCAYFGLILSADRFGMGKKKKSKSETPFTNVDKDEESIDDSLSNPLDAISSNVDDGPDFEVIKV